MSIEETLSLILTEVRALKPSRSTDDRLLSAEEAAELLACSKVFLYAHKELPFRVQIGGKVVFSYNGIQKYLERKLKMQEKK